MITDRINPSGLQEIPGLTHVTVGTGSRLVCISGQTGVDIEGKVAGSTHLDQARQAFANLRTAMGAAGIGPNDVARLNIYVVDYSEDALAAIFTAAFEELGEDVPSPASTLIGVAALWQPDLLIEIDALAIV
jgi:enamine deaminase RidA (YjgF/YER057c/UK114 family)